MDVTEPRCCGRTMTSIAVEQGASSLRLHSCPACGRHAWRSDGVEVDRPALLDALRVERTVKAKRPAAPPRVATGEGGRRAELQRMLSDFQVHGTSS
ncbi:MAG: hypothetical protein M3P46_06620 [Actinomycetota bacterium]|nr:hypothetical protein [Actinomycetota bacterium]